MRNKFVKNCIVIVLVIVGLFGLYVLAAYLTAPSAKRGHITGKNHRTKNVHSYLIAKTDNLRTLHLSPGETYLLSGEYGCDDSYFLLYANAQIPQDTFLHGNQREGGFYYWYAKISKGTIQECWMANQPIPESDLHPYDTSTQFDQLHFINPFLHPIKYEKEGWIDESDMIGYYPCT